ncbi:MAG: hypothetical protein ABL897_15050, partial [Hyphomicrobium sp.]
APPAPAAAAPAPVVEPPTAAAPAKPVEQFPASWYAMKAAAEKTAASASAVPAAAGPLPLAPRAYEAAPAAVTAKPQAETLEQTSAYAARAAALPPSEAAPARAAPAAAGTAPVSSSVSSGASSGSDSVLLSTARKGTRVLGGELADGSVIDLERAAVPRPQTPSIWSTSSPRRAVKDDDTFVDEVLTTPTGIRAERIAMRGETLFARPDAAKTIDPTAPKYTAAPRPGPVVASSVEARPLPPSGTYANVRFTLPPGALED